uniref:RNA helicase n=1 Tax=Syphacia muris TaxID=451379 RepID=A0A0N5ADR8_9BILA
MAHCSNKDFKEDSKLQDENDAEEDAVNKGTNDIQNEGNTAKVDKKKKKAKKSKEQKKNLREQKPVLKLGVDLGDAASFEQFNFDERLLKAIGEIGWEKPTQVQQNLIPLILEGKNVTARGRTGSGKTGAFMLPIIQKVVQLTSVCINPYFYRTVSQNVPGPFALFITPSKELASQAFKLLQQLTVTFPFMTSMNFAASDFSGEEFCQSALIIIFDDYTYFFQERPDMIVSTPSSLLKVLQAYSNLCEEVRCVVLDEADLLLSFGYEEEMKEIKKFLPSCYQTIFTSATLTEDIGPLKDLACGSIVTLRLKEGQLPDVDQLSQYYVKCQNDEERFTILLALIKLKLLIGKTIIFVRDTNRCYQLGLFLHAFKIYSCILNSNMPVNSRCHIVREFNDGKYNYVIASDINDVFLSGTNGVKNKNLSAKMKHIGKGKIDKESGVSRGIDFHHVSNVINFDFPQSSELYVHRVGRTARGWNKGTALSFVSADEQMYLKLVSDDLKEQMGHELIVPYEVRISELDSFLLRSREALRACTTTVIREARLSEIREELLRSRKLEGYFASNPREKASLEHDQKFFTLSLHNPAIGDVPDYIVPPLLRGKNYKPEERKLKGNYQRFKSRRRVGAMKYKRRMKDPLQSFSV